MAAKSKHRGAVLATALAAVAGTTFASVGVATATDGSTGAGPATGLEHPSSVTQRSTPGTAAPRAAEAAAEGNHYVSSAPVRTFDSRTAHRGKLGAGRAFFFSYKPGSGIDKRVRAVTYNLTVTNATADTYITVWNGQGPRPTVSNINVRKGETRAHQVTVPLGRDSDGTRTMAIYNHSGSVDVVTDLEGAYGVGEAQDGETYTGYRPSATPHRALDSRNENRTLGPDRKLTVDLSRYVPRDATAATIDLTGIANSGETYLTAFPSGSDRPQASSVNVAAGEVTPNLINVQLSQDKKIDVYNHWGSTDVIVDVFGAYSPSSANLYHPTGPKRVFDTRVHSNPLHPNQARTVQSRQPAGAAAVDANITATNATQDTYFSVYPNKNRPATSILNPTPGRDVSNEALTGVTAKGRSFKLLNHAGISDGVVDVFGYFAP